MLTEVFGAPPAVSEFNVGIGSAAVLMSEKTATADAGALSVASTTPPPATDDWPFPYLREREIDPAYLAALGFVLVAPTTGPLLVAPESRTPLAAFSPHFFAPRAAFLLLDTRSLATFCLLFGTTWLGNSPVFAAILLSALPATAVTAPRPPRP